MLIADLKNCKKMYRFLHKRTPVAGQGKDLGCVPMIIEQFFMMHTAVCLICITYV